MSLWFSYGDAQWSFGGFHEFRVKLAAHEGIDLDRMEGFADDEPVIPWSDVTSPLLPLLHHSDCDGDLPAQTCREVAPRLREVVEAVFAGGSEEWDSYHLRNGLELARGMELAATAGVSLDFK